MEINLRHAQNLQNRLRQKSPAVITQYQKVRFGPATEADIIYLLLAPCCLVLLVVILGQLTFQWYPPINEYLEIHGSFSPDI
jgi:hypothetical protein